MEERRVYTLEQVCASIKRRIEDASRGQAFWVKAEIAGINARKHVYLDLVQHHEGARVAVIRGVIWQHRLGAIRETLGEEMWHILKQGAEVLFLATVHYSPLYGLGLHVEQVDLAYSMGELERRKKATIDTLRAEGLFDRNRALHEPMVIQRIAVITSVGSAAYADFMQHLKENDHGYQFHVTVVSASVQGDAAPKELRAALETLDQRRFDAVVLIRGGGSKLDLEAFNDLELCRAVARMDIPVMTGIGHDVDVSVVDMIAKSPHRTPTAIADHLLDKCLYFETGLNGFLVGIQRVMSDSFSDRKDTLSTYAEMLRQRPRSFYQEQHNSLQLMVGQFAREVTGQLQMLSKGLDQASNAIQVLPLRRIKQVEEVRLRELRSLLEQAAQRALRTMVDRVHGMHDAIRLIDPDKVMARGFSITRKNGEALTDAARLQVGDAIETTFAQGRAESIIKSIGSNG